MSDVMPIDEKTLREWEQAYSDDDYPHIPTLRLIAEVRKLRNTIDGSYSDNALVHETLRLRADSIDLRDRVEELKRTVAADAAYIAHQKARIASLRARVEELERDGYGLALANERFEIIEGLRGKIERIRAALGEEETT